MKLEEVKGVIVMKDEELKLRAKVWLREKSMDPGCVQVRVRSMSMGWVLVRILPSCQIHYSQ